ncbi:MAG: nucleoside-diphosphate kinase [Candidatus Aquicultor secundus]|uniref:Nucleoside diphosphate kinase n=2 Tax=Candidatus Aquicultor secundus TaxID=1973895 RepID=A0A2M7T8U6_9ACTN|nr:nucleoside-diphosphate kinase [Candidatus Aquicultor secundus]NCO65069.1 nucleoside-diphosphate kinase [Solirubrobacter sp.]OIO83893.1 MAG: nucleoside-diphosphate kinase [Candidatus Aquicultor secundus]PIU27314.1 MAG: nucleoside-diphosphate kinase [Candidatus Aquicultor secundus]PIW21889.1 MAG: nucleoside-diphosphate kinase [Candidatus Aquicultor secundus]PIX52010.1 MAG: nucleoside-diphosphate kinase [Candidatus Aquicultor secundus]
MERTFTMVKPDGVRKSLAGEIIKRYESAGLKLIALKLVRLSQEKAEELYSIHKGKPFYNELVDFIISGPVVPMVLEGENAVNRVRDIMGATNPKEAAPGTIRGDFAEEISENIVHGADSVESANREIPVFFSEIELVD